MSRFTLLLLLIFFGKLSAQDQYCISGRFSNNECFTQSQVVASRDVVYAYSKNPFTHLLDTLRMDIYSPSLEVDTMTKRPFILLVHSGGFLGGTRHDMDYFCGEYAKRGYVCATIDYRLGWCGPPAMSMCSDCVADTEQLKNSTYMVVQDVRAALRFMGSNYLGWNVDPNWFFIGGTSAGSITSFLSVIWTQQDANAFAPTAQVLLGALDTAGNAFPKKYTIRGISDNCGAIPGDSMLVNRVTIPLISFHDEWDCTVPSLRGTLFGCSCGAFYKCYGSEFIHNELNAQGACTELNNVESSPEHCSFPAEMVMLRTTCFFKRIMCSACRSDTNSNLTYAENCDSLGNGQVFGIDNFSVTLAPTPGNDLVELTFSEHCRHYGTVKFYNFLGQEVFEQSFTYMTKKIELNVGDLPSGIYFLVFDYPEKIPPMKMLVTHF